MKVELDHDEICDVLEAYFKSKGFEFTSPLTLNFHDENDDNRRKPVNELSVEAYL